MKTISASYAKQNFGDVLQMALNEPVAIERHGKAVAILSGQLLPNNSEQIELKKYARLQQKNIECERLIRHQKIAIRLLSEEPSDVAVLIEKAKAEVCKWRMLESCSNDYISKWDDILQKTPEDIAQLICSDLDGWGTALRQNSPWKAAIYES